MLANHGKIIHQPQGILLPMSGRVALGSSYGFVFSIDGWGELDNIYFEVTVTTVVDQPTNNFHLGMFWGDKPSLSGSAPTSNNFRRKSGDTEVEGGGSIENGSNLGNLVVNTVYQFAWEGKSGNSNIWAGIDGTWSGGVEPSVGGSGSNACAEGVDTGGNRIYFQAAVEKNDVDQNCSLTCNFGGSAFAHTVPPGFTGQILAGAG